MSHLVVVLSSWLRLDYVSCLLTVVSTILVGRKQWTGLLIGSINSLIVCAIGWRTAQFGFIPANLFCIGIYGLSIRSWLKESRAAREPQTAHGVGRPAPTLSRLLDRVFSGLAG